MRRQAKGFLAIGAALALGAGAAHADEQHGAKTTAREPAGEKATGSTATATPGAVSKEAMSRELTGKVLQASPSKLYLEHMGAVVEFNIASDAKFSGGDVRSSGDLSEGQEVRASFTVENKTTNVAKEISLAGSAATGASSGATGSSGTTGAPSVPGERGSGTSPQERGEHSTPGMPPREPGTTPPPK